MLSVRCRLFRKSAQLPDLAMIARNARWPSALLIPTPAAADLLAGCWQLFRRLAAV
jgi:hypothetical protein